MTIQAAIEQKICTALHTRHLEVVNESHMHNVPPGSESHFKLVIVSLEFEAKGLVQRHRMINKLLADELAGPVHALALHTLTPAEWEAKSQRAPDSPECRGGSKAG